MLRSVLVLGLVLVLGIGSASASPTQHARVTDLRTQRIAEAQRQLAYARRVDEWAAREEERLPLSTDRVEADRLALVRTRARQAELHARAVLRRERASRSRQ